MARYTGPREKIERRLGEKLFLKGERSHSQKSAAMKKPYPPGQHGHRRAAKPSEFAQQLRSKQKVRAVYRLMERQFKNYVKKILEQKTDPYDGLVRALESRLDNVVYRMGFAQSRDQARQLVNHGHFLVNNKKVDIPSYTVRPGDTISIREGSRRAPYFGSFMPQWLKNHEAPAWVAVDKDAITGEVKQLPSLADSGIQISDVQAIIEFYSR
ncbi:MAG: 30S ribosomal protein S4 [Patescibacteria group bacterium]